MFGQSVSNQQMQPKSISHLSQENGQFVDTTPKEIYNQNDIILPQSTASKSTSNPKGQIPHKNWTSLEHDTLFEKYIEFGSSWHKIMQFIPGKTQNDLKNKFYGTVRKLLRKINIIGKQQIKSKKPISYESLKRPLETVFVGWDICKGFRDTNLQLMEMIITFLKNEKDPLPVSECLELIDQIHRFSLMTRCYSLKKAKKQMRAQNQQPEISSSEIPIKKEQEDNNPKVVGFVKIQLQNQCKKQEQPKEENQQRGYQINRRILRDKEIKELCNQNHSYYHKKDEVKIEQNDSHFVEQILWKIDHVEDQSNSNKLYGTISRLA